MPLSYRLHAELAEKHDGAQRWGFRRIHCGQLNARGRSLTQSNNQHGDAKGKTLVSLGKRDGVAVSELAAAGIPEDLDWFAPESVQSYSEMGDPETTAQVHPYQFTTSMAALAEEKGVKVIFGKVSSLQSSHGIINSVTYTDKGTSSSYTIPATDVIIAAGPWTKSVYPLAPIASMRAHSVVIRPSRPISAYAVFTEIALPPSTGRTNPLTKLKRAPSKTVTPEIYARPDEAYACGEGDNLVPLPTTSEQVETDHARCQDIIDYVSSISDELRDGEVLARQACYLPSVEAGSGGPLIGKTGIEGLLLATGHTCWGIQNGPATGKLMSEFVFDGKAKSASIGSLDPRKVLR